MTAAASSMPTGCILPVSACLRFLTKVSVIAVRSLIAAVDPHRGVDAVGEEVAGDARARRLDVEPPGAGAALRHVGIDRPVLEEIGAVVEDLAELARGDHLLDQASPPERSGNCTRPGWGPSPSRRRPPSSRLPSWSGRAAFRRAPSCPPSRRRWRSPCGGRSGRRCRRRRCRRGRPASRQSVSTDS